MKIAKRFMFRWWRCPIFKVWIPSDVSREEEIKILEEAKDYFEKRLSEINRRLKEIKGEK